jgi:hypothetical protein
MIRYEISIPELKKKIQNEVSTWFERANKKTARFRGLKKYKENSSIWSEVKPVYIKLQQGKCAFCERKLEEGNRGKIEWDLEHFRPKSQVRLWPPKSSTIKFAFPLGNAANKGYYLLPYHFLNYAASCKVCNTPLKSDFFPIGAKRRSLSAASPMKLLKEKAFLPYPIDSLDEDPENLLTFQGYICVPVADDGHRRKRALVTISFFGLNERDTLLKERAEAIEFAWLILEKDSTDEHRCEYLVRVRMPGFRHANCVRSFVRTYNNDHNLAEIYFQKARDYLRSTV